MNNYQYLFITFVVVLASLFLTLRIGNDRKDESLSPSHAVELSFLHSDVHSVERINLEVTSKNVKIDTKEAVTLAQSVLNLIRHRYELDGIGRQFFLTSNNIGEHTWDVIKYKFAKKITGDNEQFLMTFGGSSVTAGHDNFYYQSYPSVIERHLAPVLEALGVKLLVHNIAQGANNCIPYTMCYEAMGGLDPDFLGWEQSYNCGRDEGIFETMTRLAGFMKEKAVVYYSASGAWRPDKCPPSNDTVPYCAEDWNPDTAGLPKWSPTAADVTEEKKDLFKFYTSHNTIARFLNFGNGEKGYSQIATHGFNVWEKNPSCSVPNHPGCSGIDAAQECKMKFMTHEASLYGSGVGGAAWHPSRGFHMLRGEAITWLYTMVLLDAIHMIEKDQQKNSKAVMHKKYADKVMSLQPPLPPPKRCGVDCATKPICYTNFMPHYPSNMTLSELIVGYTNWTVDPSGVTGKVNLTAMGISEWSQQYGYLDEKPVIIGKYNSGEIHIRISIGESRTIWLCGGSAKESLKHSLIYIDENVDLSTLPDETEKIGSDGVNYGNSSFVYIPSKTRKLWTNKKYMGAECKALHELPQGKHIISIAPNITHDIHMTHLSHVIMWP